MAKSGEWIGRNQRGISHIHCHYSFTMCFKIIVCNILNMQDDTCMIFADQGTKLIRLINE